jgi:hypothetical protein
MLTETMQTNETATTNLFVYVTTHCGTGSRIKDNHVYQFITSEALG